MIRNAYLIHQSPYAFPPAHLRETMAWIASHGFTAVSIAVNEIDFEKNAFNLRSVFEAAKRHDLAVHAVPSRWGGIVAGVPGIFSGFCMENPGCLVLTRDGAPVVRPSWGYMASLYAPETFDFFCRMLERLFALCPFDGLIWDEPKSFHTIDFSPMACAVRPQDAGLAFERAQAANFFDRLCAYIRSRFPNVYLSMFVYADSDPQVLDAIAGMEALDCFGIDGNPFIPRRVTDKRLKTLIHTTADIKRRAQAAGKDSLALIESFGLTREENRLMQGEIGSVMRSGMDHLLAYYYGRNNEAPDETMQIIGEAFRALGEATAQENDA